MSTIIIAGRCGEKFAMRETKSGPVLGFSVAESTSENGEKGTRWWDVSCFGKRGESLHKLLGKGDAVTVIGRFSTREHEGKTYYKVMADVVELQGSKRDGGGTSGGGSAAKHSVAEDSDIPFVRQEWRWDRA